MMYANIQSIWNTPPAPPKPLHPEAPKDGEEVLYVNFDRERLENIYNEQ